MATATEAARNAGPAGTVQTGPKRKSKGGEGTLDPSQDFKSAMRRLIAERWGAVWRAVPVALAGDDIEGVHDVRVASRRLRAAMDVAVDCFPADWYRSLHAVAKEITGALGEVRDRDVLLAALTAERVQAPKVERPGIDRLIDRIERERAAARVEMERFLRDLLARDVPGQAARRFGPEAAAPPSLTDGAGATVATATEGSSP